MPPIPRPSARSDRSRMLLIAGGAAALVVALLIVASIALRGDGGESAGGNGATGEVGSGVALIAGIPQSGTILGDPAAAVRLLQFEDIQCPVCKRYTDDAFPDLVEEYVRPGRISIDFRGLAFLGPDSQTALRIALAAGLQNKLWDVVELFYARQGEENSGWVTDALVDEILAEVPGLDAARVKADATGPAVAKEIAAAQAEATTRKVPGTPWFYIGIGDAEAYEIQPQSLSIDAFRPALDDALSG